MALYDRLLTFLNRKKIRGKDRLYRILVNVGFRKLLISQIKYGVKVHLNPREYIDSIIIREGFYESEVTEVILNSLKERDNFWDIGASIGIHSLAVKKNLPLVNVFAFEPNPHTLGLLYENVRINKLDVKICGFALFNKSDVLTLYIKDDNSGMTTLTPWHEIKFSFTTHCITQTGDYLVNSGYSIPTVIKLDTEGSELQVLEGCKTILANPKLKVILFEAGNNFLEELESNEIAVLLKGYGFKKIKQLSRNENTHHLLSNFQALRD